MKDYKLNAAVVLRRNYADLPFRADADEEIALRVNDRSVTALERCEETFTYLLPTTLDAERRKELENKRLLSVDAANWVGGAAYLRDDELLCLETAGTDHLRIASYDERGALALCLDAALSLAGKLEDTGKIAQSAQYGFLTAYPSDAGTGMRASLLLHLPMLAMLKQLSAAMKMASTGGMTLRILSGSPGSRSDLLTTIRTFIPWLIAREICRSVRIISGSGTGAITITNSVTFATGGRRHSVTRGRISSSHPCSSPRPGVNRTRSPVIGVIRSRRNRFLHRTVYSVPCSVRTV